MSAGPELARCVAGRGVTLIRRVFDGAPPGCINLGLGQPSDPAPRVVLEALSRAIGEGSLPYGPTAGLPELRAAIAARVYGADGPSSVLVTAGSQEALWLALMGLVDPGGDVIVPEPGYPAYPAVAEMIGARPVTLPLAFDSRWRVDVRAVEAAWTDRTRLVVIASPANPTGMLAAEPAELAAIHALCEERGAWLLADEIYAPLVQGEPLPGMHRLGDRVIAIGGISKAFSCTGLRVGWLRARPDVVAGLVPLHQQVALVAPYLGQRAALACLDTWSDDGFQELRERYRRRRDALLEELETIPDVRHHDPEGAFYVFTDVSAHADDTFDLAMRLRDEARVITAPGEAFGAAGRGFLRLSFAAEPEVLREGVRRIRSVLGA